MVILKALIAVALVLFAGMPVRSASVPIRIKDMGHVLQARENQLIGFGLAVGLKNTGDTSQTGFTKQALANLLSRMGVVPQSVDFRSRNAAAVMVTATLPPFVKSGQKIDVTVSSLGDATSLQGGILLLTPLMGADEEVYAVAQGPLSIGSATGAMGAYTESVIAPPLRRQQTNVARIPDGALVEKEVPVELADHDLVTIVLDKPDFTTASRVSSTISRALGVAAEAKDAGTIIVPIFKDANVVDFMVNIENLTVVPDAVARVVINERAGTVVIGENVRIAPVAVSYGSVNVQIGDLNLYSYAGTYPGAYGAAEAGEGPALTSRQKQLQLQSKEKALTELSSGATLGDLVKALNAVGASARDLISILQAIRAAGALHAEIEVI